MLTPRESTYGLKANTALTGGGTITLTSGGDFSWTSRFIFVAGNDAQLSSQGYHEMTMPAAGTAITGVGGAASRSWTASGVNLGVFESLYYILPVGSNAASVAANFRVTSYSGALVIPEHWILIATRNDDAGFTVLKLGTGQKLKPGNSIRADSNISSGEGALSGPSVRAYATAITAVGSASWTLINLQAELHDTNDMHDNSTNNTRLTITVPGVYVVSAQLPYTHNGNAGSTAGTRRLTEIRVNGSANGDATTTIAREETAPSPNLTHSLTGVRFFNAGDYIELAVYQDSGTTMNVGMAPPAFLAATWVGNGLATAIPTRVTSLPGSPIDGQEIYYVADATNGVVWHLRYNASGGTYKWEFVGGPPAHYENDADTGTLPTAFVESPPSGPSTPTLPAGEYIVEAQGYIPRAQYVSGAAAIKLGSAATSEANDAILSWNWGTNAGQDGAFIQHGRTKVVLTSSGVLALNIYRSPGSASHGMSSRRITVTPIRVG